MSTGSSSRWSAGDGADGADDDDDESSDTLVAAAANGEGVVAAGMSNVIDEGTVRLEKSNEREAGAAEDDDDDDEALKRDEADVVAEVGMVRLEKSNAGADDDAEAEAAMGEEEGGTGARTSSREEPAAPQKASVSARRRPSDGTNDAKLKKRTCTRVGTPPHLTSVPRVARVVCVVCRTVWPLLTNA
jgi:hypothetical protein